MERGGLRFKDLSKTGYSKQSPLISVVTVVYNGGQTLERAIKSVIGQTLNNIEYIIIDGNSTDNTLEIIKKNDDYIDFWLSEPDDGIADAFNKGLSYARGDFISFLGSDDWYEPDGLQKIAEAMISDGKIYSGNANLRNNVEGRPLKMHVSRPDRIFQTMRIAHPATFVSREVFEQTGGFSTVYRIAMDYDFLLKAKIRGYEIIAVNAVIVNIMLGGISSDIVSASKEELQIKNKILGKKIKHYIWFIAYISVSKFRSLFNRSLVPSKKSYFG